MAVGLNHKSELSRAAYAVGVVALFAVGVWLRAKHLDDGVRYDEAFTFADYASKPFAEAVALYDTPNNHLLNTILVKWTAALLGDRPPLWRLPNFLAGLGAMAFVAALAGRYFGRTASLAALAVAAISPPFAHYAVLARGYALATFFAVAALFIIEKGYGDGRGTKLVWLLPACAALSCYAVPTAIIFVVALAAYDFYLVTRRPRRKKRYWLMAWAAAAVITFLLYLPPLVGSGWRAVFANPYVTGVPGEGRWENISEYLAALADGKSWGAGGLWLWGPLAAAGLAVSAARCKRFAALVSIAAALTAAVIAAGLKPPTRTFIFWLPLVAVGIGGLAESIYNRLSAGKRVNGWAVAAAVAAATLISAYAGERGGLLARAERTGAAPGARHVAAAISTLSHGNRLIIVNCPYNCPVFYYLGRRPGARIPIMFRPPHAYSKNVYVVVPPGSTAKAEVEAHLGPGWVAYGPRYVRRAGAASIWSVTLVSSEQRKRAREGRLN